MYISPTTVTLLVKLRSAKGFESAFVIDLWWYSIMLNEHKKIICVYIYIYM